jgi:hypothetical protein
LDLQYDKAELPCQITKLLRQAFSVPFQPTTHIRSPEKKNIKLRFNRQLKILVSIRLRPLNPWDVPTRGFKIIEKTYKIVSGEKVYIKEETFLCMATLPAELADADIVRQIVHAKWRVESNAIKDLKDNWYTGIWNTISTTTQMPLPLSRGQALCAVADSVYGS